MENASKALIIAGAILLAILIISLGLVIFNNARDQVGNANLDEQTIQAFNSKFTTFEGTKVTGTKVNSLIETVIASNQAEERAGTTHYVKVGTASVEDKYVKASGNTDSPERVNSGKAYSVTIGYGDNGLVSKITIGDAT